MSEGARRPRLRRAAAILLGLHLLLGTAAFVTMDMDLDRGPLRDLTNHLVDGYEWIGFDLFFVGLLLPAVILGSLLLATRGPAGGGGNGSSGTSA